VQRNPEQNAGGKKGRKRLDVALVERGLVETRARAQSLIMARRISVNGAYVDKPGANVVDADELIVVALEHPWVGRGGMKLAKAIEEFHLELAGKTCLDVGASTGGFTDVMLHHGAARVYAIDVGYGQLDQKLRNDERVVNREKVNARYLDRADFPDEVTFASIDVSFISLKMILEPVFSVLTRPAEVVALIKPQFEVGKREIEKGGIVRDPEKRQSVIDDIVAHAHEAGGEVVGVIESPIKGAEGNVEFLMYVRLV
jgi:23S rRNA (cytidine1920-2'-O)/16S rRNA (cytidine1409-2'-O)-methyltransferase